MALAGIIVVLLGVAAWRDFATRTIPDAVSLGVLLAGVIARSPEGWAAVGTSASVAFALFVSLLPFHSRGLVGGGDLKLLSALAFGLSPLASYQMVSAVVLIGGLHAIAYLALRRFLELRDMRPPSAVRHSSIARRVMVIELWRIRKGAPLPYGLAIAAGASLVIGHQGA